MRRSFRFPEVVAWSVPILVTLAIGSYLFPRFHFDALVTSVSPAGLGCRSGSFPVMGWAEQSGADTSAATVASMSLPFRRCSDHPGA
jgi:hypothetical protein